MGSFISRLAVQVKISTPFVSSDVAMVSKENGVSMCSVAACCPTTGCPFLVHSSRGMGCAITEQLSVMVGGVLGSSRTICWTEGLMVMVMSRRTAAGEGRSRQLCYRYTFNCQLLNTTNTHQQQQTTRQQHNNTIVNISVWLYYTRSFPHSHPSCQVKGLTVDIQVAGLHNGGGRLVVHGNQTLVNTGISFLYICYA